MSKMMVNKGLDKPIERVAKRANRADLLAALLAVDEVDLVVAAHMAGFEKPNKSTDSAPASVQLDISKLSTPSQSASNTLNSDQPSAASSSSVQSKPHYYRLTERKASEQMPEHDEVEVRLPAWFEQTPALDLQSVKPAKIKPPAKPALVKWSSAWPLLKKQLSEERRSQQADLPKLINKLAHAELLTSIPKQSRQAWQHTLTVLLDYSEHTSLFNDDYRQCLQQLMKMRGETGCSVLQLLEGLPGKSVRIRQGQQYQSQPWTMPAAGSTVLIMSDLGLLDSSSHLHLAWLRFGQRLHQAGCTAIALLPLPKRYLTQTMLNVFQCISWDGQLRLVHDAHPHRIADLRAYSLSEQASEAAASEHPTIHALNKDKASIAKTLLAWLSPAVSVEPSLLRAVRQQLPADVYDVGSEIAAWSHEDVHRSSTGFRYEVASLADYREQCRQQAKQDPALATRIASTILAYHRDRFPTQRYEELLVLSDLLTNQLPTAYQPELKQARLHMQQLCKALYLHPDQAPALPVFIHHYVSRQHTAMWQEKGNAFISAMWLLSASRYQPNQRLVLPEGFDPSALLFLQDQQVAAEDYVLFQQGVNDVFLSSQSMYQQGQADFSMGSQLANFTGKSSYAYSERPLPNGRTQKTLLPLHGQTQHFPLLADEQQSLTVAGEALMIEAFTQPAWANRIGRDHYGLWADVHIEGICSRFRWIEPSTFLMGSPETERGRYDDEVQHQVTLSQGYWMADTACTQALWQAVMQNNPSEFQGAYKPVENVSWKMAQEFISTVNQKLPALQLRLPSEAEWEHACRAGTSGAFNFTGTLSLKKVNYQGRWEWESGTYVDGALKQTAKVKAYPANAWGLYEMHGNVWEWCQDWYEAYPSEAVIDPKGATAGFYRVLRGGSWISYGRYVRSANRDHFSPGYRYYDAGFRLARGH